MILIEIPETLPISLDPAFIQEAARAALESGSTPISADLTIVLTNNAQLQQLNKQFLGLGTPTDVLSFPAGEVDPDTDRPYLGDVLISVERAQAQALTHPLEDELRLLVVHGVLHLLGHDHAEETEKALMWRIQREVLYSLGCESIMPE
jgi:probable rRNA maturation factor